MKTNTIKLFVGEYNGKKYYNTYGLTYIDGNKDSHFSGFNNDNLELNSLIGEENASKLVSMIQKLHLADSKGFPMYAVENGIYWLKVARGEESNENVGITKATQYLANLLRINIDSAEFIIDQFDKPMFLNFIEEQRERWEREANDCLEFISQLKTEFNL